MDDLKFERHHVEVNGELDLVAGAYYDSENDVYLLLTYEDDIAVAIRPETLQTLADCAGRLRETQLEYEAENRDGSGINVPAEYYEDILN